MKVKTILNETELERIAQDLGLKLNDYVKTGFNNHCKFTLKHTTSVINKTKYVKKGYYGRRVNSACLHGYTMFMIKVFEKDPEALFRSIFGIVNKDNIAEKYDEIAYQNMGSIIEPVYYTDACFCSDNDVAQVRELLE